MARTLAQFSIITSGEDYVLQLEDEDGETVEMLASFDQLDLISEAIDLHLDDDAEELDEATDKSAADEDLENDRPD